MSKDNTNYGGYFFTRNGVRIFVPTDDEKEAKYWAKKVFRTAVPSADGKIGYSALKVAYKLKNRFPTIELDKTTYGALCHILFSNLSENELGCPLICKDIGTMLYTAINFGDTHFEFIDIFDTKLSTFRDIDIIELEDFLWD